MNKDRKSKARALSTAVGASAAVGTGVIVALALTMSAGAPPSRENSVIYPLDLANEHGAPVVPPAP